MHNQEYSYPVFMVNSGIATSGHKSDIAPGQLGLFSRNTYNVVTTPSAREEVFFAFGSTRKFDKLGDMAGYQQPEISSFFKVKDVQNFEVSFPQKESKSNKVSVGYSGGSCSESLAFECGKNYVLKFYLKGSPLLRYFGKPLEKIISYNTGCCPNTDCTTGCDDYVVDPAFHTKAIVELINNELELKQAGAKARFVASDYVAVSVLATGTATIGAGAVTGVTGIVGGKGYTNGATVTFGGPGINAAGTVTVVNGVVTAVVITVPGTGYVSVPTVTFSNPANMKTKYCLEVCDNGDNLALAQVQTNVGNKGRVISTGRKDCKSLYEYCGDVIAADLVPTQEVALAICGACAPGYTLVAATDSYTIERVLAPGTVLVTNGDKTTFANAIATAYSGSGAVFNSLGSGVAFVTIQVPKDTVVTSINSDIITKGITKEASCVPTVLATPIEWVACGTAYKVSRKLKITLSRTDCAGADRLAELTAFYATNPDIVVDSLVKLGGSVGCEDCYEISQWSKGCMTDECLATDSAEFDTLGSFGGVLWEVVPEVAAIVPGRKVGFTVEFSIPEVFFSNASFDPNEFYEDEPISLEVAWELNYPDTCAIGALPKIKDVRSQKFRRQSGEWVMRKLIEWQAYHWGESFNTNPRIREALGQEILTQVDRKAFYKVYYTKFVESRAGVNTFAEQPRVFEPLIIFKESDARAADFEKMYGTAIASQGISLNLREDTNW